MEIVQRYAASWKPVLYVVDGVQAHAERRFCCMESHFDARSFEVRYVNPVGRSYEHESTVVQIADDVIACDRPVTFLGASMGARTLYDVINELEERGAYPNIERFAMIDPLFDGSEVKVPGSKLLVKLGKLPGVDSWLSWLPGAFAGKDNPGDSYLAKAHHAYSRGISVRRWSQEVATSLRPGPTTWRPTYPLLPKKVCVLLSEKDEVLTGDGGYAYTSAFGKGGIMMVPEVKHVRVPEHPEIYQPALEWALDS